MSENANLLEKVKSMFHEDVKARTEVSDGVWDAKASTYTRKDEATGVTAVYTLKKNKALETGYSAKVRYYKEKADANGQSQQVEMTFDKKKDAWVQKTKAQKAMDMLQARPKLMGTLNEKTIPGQAEPVRTITIEPAKVKPGPTIIPVRI